MVEVEGATGEIDTNFEGKLEATWASLQKYDFVCVVGEEQQAVVHVRRVQTLGEGLDEPAVEPFDGPPPSPAVARSTPTLRAS